MPTLSSELHNFLLPFEALEAPLHANGDETVKAMTK
jgi:hypothetical protein